MTCQKEYENLNCNHVCRLYPRHQLHRKTPKYQGFGDFFMFRIEPNTPPVISAYKNGIPNVLNKE